jgi:hypothetical protein
MSILKYLIHSVGIVMTQGLREWGGGELQQRPAKGGIMEKGRRVDSEHAIPTDSTLNPVCSEVITQTNPETLENSVTVRFPLYIITEQVKPVCNGLSWELVFVSDGFRKAQDIIHKYDTVMPPIF